MADRNVWKSPPHCAAWADGMTTKARKAKAMDLVMNFGMTEPAFPPKLFLHCHDRPCPAAPVVPEQHQYDNPTNADHRLSRPVTHALGSPPAPMLRGADDAKGLLGHYVPRDQGHGEACGLCQAGAHCACAFRRALPLPRQPECDFRGRA